MYILLNLTPSNIDETMIVKSHPLTFEDYTEASTVATRLGFGIFILNKENQSLLKVGPAETEVEKDDAYWLAKYIDENTPEKLGIPA